MGVVLDISVYIKWVFQGIFVQNQIAALLGDALFNDVERHAAQRFAAMNGFADAHNAALHAGYFAEIHFI